MGNAEFMEVEERTREGYLIRILRIPDYSLALSASVLSAEREAYLGGSSSSLLRETAEKTPASGTRPAYSKIIVDPSGAVWLQQYQGESEAAEPQRWLVLEADGTWLGTVEVPGGFRILDIEMDAVLGVWYDELDVQHPQVLRLVRG